MGICNTNAVLRPVPEANASNARNTIKRGGRPRPVGVGGIDNKRRYTGITNRPRQPTNASGTQTENKRRLPSIQATTQQRNSNGKAAVKPTGNQRRHDTPNR